MPISKLALCQLGPAYISWIHDDVIGSVWPGIDPVSKSEYRNQQLLESALGRPFHSMDGQDFYPTTIEKAAALFHSLISNHPFWNGNKRTAVVAVDIFLTANGYVLALDNNNMYQLAERTASYRKRGITHEQCMHEILGSLTELTTTFRELYVAQKSNQKLSDFYRKLLVARQTVRRNPHNRLIGE